MKRQDVLKGAALIARADALRARVKAFGEGDCVYVTCDIGKKDKTSFKNGFDGGDDVRDALVGILTLRISALEDEIAALGIND